MPDHTIPRISDFAGLVTSANFAKALDPDTPLDQSLKSIIHTVTPVMRTERDMDAALQKLSGGINLTYLGGAVMTTCLRNGILHDSG